MRALICRVVVHVGRLRIVSGPDRLLSTSWRAVADLLVSCECGL